MEALHDVATRTTLVARQSQGSAQNTGSSSASALLSAIIPPALIAIIFISIFLVFRQKFQRIYLPRTFVGRFNDDEKTPMPSPGMFGWIKDFRGLPDDYIFNHQSIDGYLFLRYIKMAGITCLVGMLLTWPILMPVNATAPPPPVPSGQKPPSQFDILSFSNSAASPNRYYAHAFVAWIFFGFVMFLVARESIFYIHLRQAWLLSPNTASRMSSRTVLFTDVPKEYQDEASLHSIFPHIKHIWIATDTKELEDLVKERDKTAMKLEGAEIKLSQQTNKQRLKMIKKKQAFDNPMEFADANRPTHKLKFLIGKKVDTIDWCREHLQELIPKTEALQATHWNGEAKVIPAVFIEFETIQAAEAAYQQLTYHKPKVLQPRAIGMRPQEVVWKNLDKTWIRRDVMYVAATALVVLMIIFWTPFTIFVGAVANINYLITKVPFLSFINDIPSVILGVVTGLLPVIILSVLMSLVPIFLRMIANLTGPVTIGEIEMQVQNWYYAFQVIQVFLVTTFASGAAAVAAQIVASPGSAPGLLAQNLPKASNFYNSYILFQAISAIGSMLLNIGGLAVFIILKNLLKKTPRKRYMQYLSISGLGWGSTYPKIEIFTTIALTYAIISPLILGFAAIGFLLFYIAFRHNLFYVLDTSNISTQGATYPRALQHVMVGVYLSEVCLVGLLAITTGSAPAAAGPLVIVILLLVATIFFHIALSNALKPLVKFLPRDLLFASTRKQGVDTQMEVGGAHHGVLGQNANTLNNGSSSNGTTSNGPNSNGAVSNDTAKEMQAATSEAVLSSSKHQPGLKGMLIRIVHPSWLPPLADHLAHAGPDYPEDVRREAYLDAAITSPTPLLWLVHDDMGVSTREKELSGKVIGTTDQGAYWEEKKGNLVTVWEDQPFEKQDALVREAPIYEDRPRF